MPQAPWSSSFRVEGNEDDEIGLIQIGPKEFRLTSTVTYVGTRTGLEDKLTESALDEIRTVSPAELPTTDLASVPTVLRWFVGPYGIHTPAALIHDWLIPQPDPPAVAGMTDQYADRYWRFMLEDLGVRIIRRWLMWSAVAMRTRWHQRWPRKLALLVWGFASLVGMVAFVAGIAKGAVLVVVLAALAPLIFAALWERQYGAGIVAAYSAPWLVPPTILAALGYVVYWISERLIGLILPSRSGTQPIDYSEF